MKRFAALFIVFALLLVVISGCRENTPGSESAEESKTVNSQEASESEKETDQGSDPADENKETDPESAEQSETGSEGTDQPATDQPTEPAASEPATEPATDPTPQTLTGRDGKTLREIAVDYMKQMASIEWTAGVLIDYSSQSPTLVYKPGEKYLGMVYNNNATGLEKFLSILDENNVSFEQKTSWNESPGNSCATSIRHAWQQVSPDVEFGYSFDMLPAYENTGVKAIGNIDWSQYNGTNTLTTVFNKNNRDDLYEAYAMMLPGDALVRYIDTGGHAQMITKEPFVLRRSDGTIDPENSYLYIAEQNNLLNKMREYPSSWKVDYPVSFATCQNGSYLPVTIQALIDGTTTAPVFEFSSVPTKDDLAAGTIKGNLKCSYAINEVRFEFRSNGEVVKTYSAFPYSRSFGFKTIRQELGLGDLPAGSYELTVTAFTGMKDEVIFSESFTKE